MKEIIAEIMEFANERDWKKFHTPKNLSMALSVEAGELLEHFLWCDPSFSELKADPEELLAVERELADVLIYSLQMYHYLGGEGLDQDIKNMIQANSDKMEKLNCEFASKKIFLYFKGNRGFADSLTDDEWNGFYTPRYLSSELSVASSYLLESFVLADPAFDELKAIEEGHGQVMTSLVNVMMYGLEMFFQLGVDPEKAIRDKMVVNGERYVVG
ncbi:MAG: nucleotide pyrophosphohydrolase [Thermoplasmata archaeon]|nr:nucleotide pyrophosphohydrolase [Thermoplasmata archaeon]